jgi:hypothetical protein
VQEYNTKQFNIEYSTDGTNFTTLDMLPAKNAATGAGYSFSHSTTFNGPHFYRLKIIDIDGQITYSSVIQVILNNSIKNFIHPAVISDGNILVTTGNTGFRSFELFSMSGALVFSKNISGQTGVITVQAGKVAPGIYMARLQSGAKFLEQKIVIQ